MKDEQMLICRKEPGQQKSTGKMYLSRGDFLEIPSEIDEENITVDQVKNILNELFSLSFIDADPTSSNNFSARPSYRDLMAFIFQPQNVIANNRVLFYNIEKMEHKSKLINIFPYVLGAVNAETLAAMQERDRLTKERDKLARDINNIKNVSESWRQEVLTWLSVSRELGLTTFNPDSTTNFGLQVDELKKIISKNENDSSLIASNVTDTSDELLKLRAEERELSIELSAARKRHEAMKELDDSKKRYDESLQIQRNRLDISSWLRSLSGDMICPICGKTHDEPNQALDELCDAVAEIEKQAGIVQGMSISFDREFNIVKAEIYKLTEKLTGVRRRINEESAKSQQNANTKYTLASVSRFLGRMEFAIQTYERIGTDGDLEERLSKLNDRISELNKSMSDNVRVAKEKAALSFIQQEASTIIKQLDVENPDDPIEFDKTNLTIKVRTADGRDNYLWEIGSASNWLSYHISISLAFQKFFQERKGVSVPNILVFDQPSQVYFPQKGIQEGSTAEEDSGLIQDEDKAAVKKIFATLSTYIEKAKSELQIIVMEHADEDIWGEFDNITLVERWRGSNKLIPVEWISKID
ncbi:DUF3732 domain-containing protein|uniref:DUF3732 domain-containing protein n=1 Tax=Dendrosporobacter quercicolus TaxID=146817 RepID=UPI00156FAD57|nr:DUF3732 domain-containing protein [Dendrosporobacter quercicolus]NSL46841.1 DUF3732 domain-containing protein [Dendrosporobacter quercicolus DSM 1736]